MKPIFKVLLFALAVVLLDQCEREEPNPQVNIPDSNFLNALIELGVDTNGDSIISAAEAEAIISLNVGWQDISDMTGIEKFVKLDTLFCHRNKLTRLDFSHNTTLKSLYCSENQLIELNITKNTFLVMLFCNYNQLTILDVSNNQALLYLNCNYNHLTNLDVTKNIALTLLDCSLNGLTSLDVSNNIALTGLCCAKNQLTSLDVLNNIALGFLDCSENQMTNLDISNNVLIGSLPKWYRSALNHPLPDLDISDMPVLYEVCVWEMPFPPSEVYVDTTGSPNIYFTTDCSK